MQIGTKILPFSTLHLEVCESTHVWVLNNLHLLVDKYGLSPIRPVRVSTDIQTKGVGLPITSLPQSITTSSNSRKHKVWVTTPGNIAATFVFPWPQKKIDRTPQLSLVASVAVVNTLKNLGLNPQVKWVNDILLNGKKVGGILCNSTGYQLQADHESFTIVLISIGLNVLSIPLLNHLDKEEQQPITCIVSEMGLSVKNDLPDCNQVPIVSDVPILSDVPIPPNVPITSTLSPFSSTDTISPSFVLDLLSHNLYQSMSLYECHGFHPIYSTLTPILFGKGKIITIKNPLINPTSIQQQQCNHISGTLVDISPEMGVLLLSNNNNIIEILDGRISIVNI